MLTRLLTRLARTVVARPRVVVGAWLVLAVLGVLAAPRATEAFSHDFGLPGSAAHETNQRILTETGSGGYGTPVLLVVGDGRNPLDPAVAEPLLREVDQAVPGARTTSFAQQPELLSADGTTGVVLVHPRPVPGPAPVADALRDLGSVAERASSAGVPVAVTGAAALAADQGAHSGGTAVLVETLVGGLGALLVLLLVFGSALAALPLVVAAASILTTFAVVWGLTGFVEVSFIVQYLLALIGLGVAIDYALLVVTRWREELAAGADQQRAVELSLVTAGRSVVFSGVTVAVSLAALIALPVPFLRSVGIAGLLIPLVSVVASLTLLPALVALTGTRLDRSGRRRRTGASRTWRRVGEFVVRRRWTCAVVATAVLLGLGSPVLGLRLGAPSDLSLASAGGPAATAVEALHDSGIGAGLTFPVEVVTDDVPAVLSAVTGLPGVAGAVAPTTWTTGTASVVEVWTEAESSSAAGSAAADAVRAAAERVGGAVGGVPAQNEDFLSAVYGNAWWVLAFVVLATSVLLAVALRSVLLPVKALVLNVVSIAAAYGMTVLIWQDGVGTEFLFSQSPSGAVSTWVPVAVFAFLFGLSMDYEVFLLSRIREERERGASTDEATVAGVAHTGRLVSSAALILFLAFVALSRVPATDVKILATALALGILLDATVVRGVLAPALVAGFGRGNWWWPFGGGRRVG